MTAPVSQSASEGEQIAMTAPVTQAGDRASWTVRFIMPANASMETLPQPNNSRVTLTPLPAQRFAVVRFSGLANERDIGTKTQDLRRWMASRDLTPMGEATLARYDPPWTLWFMRRNELLFPITHN